MKPYILIAFYLILAIHPFSESASKEQFGKNSKDKVIAVVNGSPVTELEIRVFYNRLPPQYKKISYQKIRDKLIDRIIEQRLIAEAAINKGLHNNKIIKAHFAAARRSVLNEAYLSEIIKNQISETKVRDEYQKSIALQPKRVQVRARHILVKTKTEAIKIISLLKKGINFVKLAKERSIGPSSKNGGDLGFFSEEQMVPPFSKAAFSLEIGKFTLKPVKTQFGFHVIKVEGKRRAGNENYEQAISKIRNNLLGKIFEQSINALRSRAKIEMLGDVSKIKPIR